MRHQSLKLRRLVISTMGPIKKGKEKKKIKESHHVEVPTSPKYPSLPQKQKTNIKMKITLSSNTSPPNNNCKTTRTKISPLYAWEVPYATSIPAAKTLGRFVDESTFAGCLWSRIS